MKACTKCGEVKPLEDFHKEKKQRDGRTSRCKVCYNADCRKRYHKNESQSWAYQLRKKYGIGPDDYSRMLEEQGGCCAICGKHHSDLSKRMAVDHNHATGEVRGLLCADCNTGIGKLNDDPAVLRRACEYLEEHGHYG